jgi:resuscitation-promoting factor RpfB
MSNTTPAGWYPDSRSPGQLRYWNGTQWTGHTAPSGPTSNTTPAGWYPDSQSPGQLRYWNGTKWTGHTAPIWPNAASSGPQFAGYTQPLSQSPTKNWVLRHKVLSAVSALVVVAVIAGAAGSNGDPDDTAKDADGSASAEASPSADEPQSEESEPEKTETAEATETPTSEAVPAVTEPARSVMPQVAGLTRQAAEEALATAGLGVREVREIPSPQPVGTVLRQGKEVGASVLAGTAIVLVVAAPYPSIPSVVGKSQQGAVSRLQAAGFKVTVTTEARTSGKDGVVLRQSPEGTELAKLGSTITVVVSDVVRPVVAPPSQNCTAGYRPCLTPASDYDCGGGSGDGPEYAYGPIYITGSDPYDLDADGDGVACES